MKYIVIDESIGTKRGEIKNRLKGILSGVKNKCTAKKSVSWRPENDLQQVMYFEFDETERGMFDIIVLI